MSVLPVGGGTCQADSAQDRDGLAGKDPPEGLCCGPSALDMLPCLSRASGTQSSNTG